ncbi:MAG: thiamine-phosphate pyrophosphorylase [Parvicellaceae bacterium]|jgi:thiamine-phosphate pyrophosphorylase
MKLVVFSSKEKTTSEIPFVIQMFENGLETFHLRKPRFGTKELEEYISAIPKEYRSRVIIHSHHELAAILKLKGIHYSRTHRKKGLNGKAKFGITRLAHRKMKFTKSCHALSSIQEDIRKYDYVFLSPVFDSISKEDYKSKFSLTKTKEVLDKTRQTVYALGGLNPSNIELAVKTGFDGIALLGYVWESKKNPLEAFLEVKLKLKEIEAKSILEN